MCLGAIPLRVSCASFECGVHTHLAFLQLQAATLGRSTFLGLHERVAKMRATGRPKPPPSPSAARGSAASEWGTDSKVGDEEEEAASTYSKRASEHVLSPSSDTPMLSPGTPTPRAAPSPRHSASSTRSRSPAVSRRVSGALVSPPASAASHRALQRARSKSLQSPAAPGKFTEASASLRHRGAHV